MTNQHESIRTGKLATARLLAIVAVSPANRVLCQQPGCGHGVYAAIHVVEEADQLLVLGSTCFEKRYGSEKALGQPLHAGASGTGRALTEEERQLLVENTAELISRFKIQAEAARAQAMAKLQAMRRRLEAPSFAFSAPAAPSPAPVVSQPARPWPWQRKHSSVAVLRDPEGQHWVRVQHQDGSQKLVPWPTFEGWDEALPPSCGQPDQDLQAYSVPNIVATLTKLRQMGFSEPKVGVWPEVRPQLS